MTKENYRKSVLSLFIILISCSVFMDGICLAEMGIIDIRNREASGLLPMVESMLSKEGTAFADTLTNSIIVNDSPETIGKIREFLKGYDKPVPQVKIRFRFQEKSLSRDRGVSVSGRASGKRWSVSTGNETRDGVHVSVRDRSLNRDRYSETFISVLSGSAAYISVGKMVPYTDRWAYLCRRYAHFVEAIRFRRIDTGMEVKPVVAGNLVHMDIVPRISYEEKGREGVIRFVEASTRLVAPRGEWVSLGGDSKETNEVIRHILSRGSTENRTDMTLLLMVE